jgi:hypothetical protein
MSKLGPFENMPLAGHDFGFGTTAEKEKKNMSKETRSLMQGNDVYTGNDVYVEGKKKKPCKTKKGCKRCDHEKVDSPAHYNVGEIEVIDAIEDWKLGFNDGNAIKYIARHQRKEKPIQDIEKAIWYLKRHLTNLKEKENNG